MQKSYIFSILFFFLLMIYGCSELKTPVENSEQNSESAQLDKGGFPGNIVVANRSSGSISVIDTRNDKVSGTYQLPGNSPEPMYVVFVNKGGRVFVGDRANSQVVVFRASDFSVETIIPVGQGVFHMWADPQGKQLWVNNDIDKTTSVVDLHSLQVIATIPTPPDLVAIGGIPHDVILGPNNKYGYITVLGLPGPSDYVVQFSTDTFQETGRAEVGKDPHLSLTQRNNNLYVPCQNSNAVYILDRFNMNVVETVSIPGTHGAGMPTNGKVFYTSNLPGGGSDGIIALSTDNNQIIGTSDTPFPVPHNIAFTPAAKKLYLTHSGGTSNKVTVYKVSNKNPIPKFLTEITVELNPFGLAFSK